MKNAIYAGAIQGLIGGVLGAFILRWLGMGEGFNELVWVPIGATIGGGVNGYLRFRKSQKD